MAVSKLWPMRPARPDSISSLGAGDVPGPASAAREAIERNMDSYDTSTSAVNLKRLIVDETQVP